MVVVNRDLLKLEECVFVDGVDVNYIFIEFYIFSYYFGGIALYIVVEKGYIVVIEDMLMLGVNFCFENKFGDFVMYIVCKYGNS